METYYKVQQGECLSSIARQYGFTDYHAIYDHPKNALLKKKRPNPNQLFPGDCLLIPDKQEKREARGTTQLHKFQLPTVTVLLRLALFDDNSQPYAGKHYVLKLEDGSYRGCTNAQGLIEQKIPANATEATVTLWPDEEDKDDFICSHLVIGSLDPVEEISGVQARLNNLGFFCGSVDGVVGPKTEQALKRFQKKAGLDTTGKIDAATCNCLRNQHDTASEKPA